VISHALCEALINAIMAIGLAKAGAPDLFPLIEKNEFKRKWLHGPKCFRPTYQFPHGTALHETLVNLAAKRNTFVHYKIELEIDGKMVFEGSKNNRKDYCDDLKWIRRYFSMPYDLAEMARKAIGDFSCVPFLDRQFIDTVPGHAGVIDAMPFNRWHSP
jgi:hypothetical protein